MIPRSKRSAGGEIAVWRNIANGLTRAARKSFRVGADGDLARYPAESYDCTITWVSCILRTANARWYRRSCFYKLLSLQIMAETRAFLYSAANEFCLARGRLWKRGTGKAGKFYADYTRHQNHYRQKVIFHRDRKRQNTVGNVKNVKFMFLILYLLIFWRKVCYHNFIFYITWFYHICYL